MDVDDEDSDYDLRVAAEVDQSDAAATEGKIRPLPAYRNEKRMLSFVKDPESSTKVFLSSFFRDKGLIW
jgi:hypothetical protein